MAVLKRRHDCQDRLCDNLFFDGNIEYKNTFWSNTKENLKDFFNVQLNIQRIKIKRAQGTGGKNGSST